MPITMEPHGGPSLIGMIMDAWEAMKAPGKAYNEGMTPDEMIKAGNNFAMTMGAGGSLAPKPANSLGMFGGRLAKTANLEKLAQAEKFEKAGVDPDSIWKATGWGRGKDGKWRFEIDDSQARMKPDAGKAIKDNWGPVDYFESGNPIYGEVPKNLEDVFHHPEFFAAYPDARKIKIVPEYTNLGVSYGGKIGIDPDLVPLKQSNVMLHELQHELQNVEGFAKGNSAQDPYSAIQTSLADSALNQGNAESFDLMQKLSKLPQTSQLTRKLYKQSAGEVEARAVQARQAFNKLRRAIRSPWRDEDTPRMSQIPFGVRND
jgi:hypothetical protein